MPKTWRPGLEAIGGADALARVRRGELDLDMLDMSFRYRVRNQGVHLPSVKVGCQRPRGQKRTEMMY
jgi:hypothetical protein